MRLKQIKCLNGRLEQWNTPKKGNVLMKRSVNIPCSLGLKWVRMKTARSSFFALLRHYYHRWVMWGCGCACCTHKNRLQQNLSNTNYILVFSLCVSRFFCVWWLNAILILRNYNDFAKMHKQITTCRVEKTLSSLFVIYFDRIGFLTHRYACDGANTAYIKINWKFF